MVQQVDIEHIEVYPTACGGVRIDYSWTGREDVIHHLVNVFLLAHLWRHIEFAEFLFGLPLELFAASDENAGDIALVEALLDLEHELLGFVSVRASVGYFAVGDFLRIFHGENHKVTRKSE